jgi:hypothetical protein
MGYTRNYGSLRDAAIRTKQQIFQNGQELVRLGVLPQEVFDANADAYLPRVILRYLMDGSGALIRAGGDMKASDLGYLKRKKDIDELLMKSIMGVVENPAFLAAKTIIQVGRDIPLMDLFRTVKALSTPERDPLTGEITQAAQQNWMLEKALADINYANIINKVIADKGLDFTQEGLPPAVRQTQDRQVTPEFLRAEADRLENKMSKVYDRDSQLGQLVQGVANEFRSIANAIRDDVPNYNTQGYSKLPDSPQYGDLRGAWVVREIYDQLVGSEISYTGNIPVLSQITAALNIFTANFKAMAVPMNPKAWGGNIASNTHQIHAAGVPLYMIPVYRAKAVKALAENHKGTPSAQFNRFRDQGLILSTFASNELDDVTVRLWPKILSSEKTIRELVQQQLANPTGEHAVIITKRTAAALGRQWSLFKEFFGDRYQDLELMDKLTIAMYLEDNGTSAAEAMHTANEYLFDYGDVPNWLRAMRKSVLGAPFVTWAYKAGPRLVKDLRTPKGAMRTAIYYMVMYGAAKAALEADLTDEEREAFYAAQPPGRKYRGPYVIPSRWLNDNGKPVALDLSMYFPHAMFVNAIMATMPDPIQEKWHGSEFGITDALKDMGAFSHPLLTYIVEAMTNRDTFTGREIANEDGPNATLEKWAHFFDSLIPLDFWFKMTELSTGVNVKPWQADSTIMDSKGKPRNTLGTELLSTVTGVRGYAFDGDDQYKYRGYDLKQQKKATGKYYDELIAQSDDPAERAELRRERAKEMKAWSDKIRNRPKAFKPEMIRD